MSIIPPVDPVSAVLGIGSLVLGKKSSDAQADASQAIAGQQAAAQQYAAELDYKATQEANKLLKEQFDSQLAELQFQYDKSQQTLQPFLDSGSRALSSLEQKVLAGPDMKDDRLQSFIYNPAPHLTTRPSYYGDQLSTPESTFEGFGEPGRGQVPGGQAGAPSDRVSSRLSNEGIRTPGIYTDPTGNLFTVHPTTGIPTQLSKDSSYIDQNGFLALNTKEHGWLSNIDRPLAFGPDGKMKLLPPDFDVPDPLGDYLAREHNKRLGIETPSPELPPMDGTPSVDVDDPMYQPPTAPEIEAKVQSGELVPYLKDDGTQGYYRPVSPHTTDINRLFETREENVNAISQQYGDTSKTMSKIEGFDPANEGNLPTGGVIDTGTPPALETGTAPKTSDLSEIDPEETRQPVQVPERGILPDKGNIGFAESGIYKQTGKSDPSKLDPSIENDQRALVQMFMEDTGFSVARQNSAEGAPNPALMNKFKWWLLEKQDPQSAFVNENHPNDHYGSKTLGQGLSRIKQQKGIPPNDPLWKYMDEPVAGTLRQEFGVQTVPVQGGTGESTPLIEDLGQMFEQVHAPGQPTTYISDDIFTEMNSGGTQTTDAAWSSAISKISEQSVVTGPKITEKFFDSLPDSIVRRTNASSGYQIPGTDSRWELPTDHQSRSFLKGDLSNMTFQSMAAGYAGKYAENIKSFGQDPKADGRVDYQKRFKELADAIPEFKNASSTQDILIADAIASGGIIQGGDLHKTLAGVQTDKHASENRFKRDVFTSTVNDVIKQSDALSDKEGRARLDTEGIAALEKQIGEYTAFFPEEMKTKIGPDRQFKAMIGMDPWTSGPVDRDAIGGWVSQDMGQYLPEAQLDPLIDQIYGTFQEIEADETRKQTNQAVLDLIQPLAEVIGRPAYDTLYNNLKEFGLSEFTPQESSRLDALGQSVAEDTPWAVKESQLRKSFEGEGEKTVAEQEAFEGFLASEKQKHESNRQQASINKLREERGLPPVEAEGATSEVQNQIAALGEDTRAQFFKYSDRPEEGITDPRLDTNYLRTVLESDPRFTEEYKPMVDYSTDPRFQAQDKIISRDDPRLTEAYSRITDPTTDIRTQDPFDFQSYLDADPRYRHGQDYTQEDYEKSPGYQFRLDEATKAIERGAAARTGALSGAAQNALAKFTSDYAYKDFAQERSVADQRSQQAITEAQSMAQEFDRRRLQAIQENRFDEAEFYSRQKEGIDGYLKEQLQYNQLREAGINERIKEDTRHFSQRAEAIGESQQQQAFASGQRKDFQDEYYRRQAIQEGRRSDFQKEYYGQQEIQDKRRQNALNEYYQSLAPLQSLSGQGQTTAGQVNLAGQNYAQSLGTAGQTFAQQSGQNLIKSGTAQGQLGIAQAQSAGAGIMGATSAKLQGYENIQNTLSSLYQQSQTNQLIDALRKQK
jgi:hypothetical protein